MIPSLFKVRERGAPGGEASSYKEYDDEGPECPWQQLSSTNNDLGHHERCLLSGGTEDRMRVVLPRN